MRESRELVCVTCPVGCALRATLEEGELASLEGQACKRGIAFAQEELTAPKRMLTTTVKVIGGALPLVPVRTREPIPKEALLALAAQMREVELLAPVSEHQTVLANALGTGVDVITSRALERA